MPGLYTREAEFPRQNCLHARLERDVDRKINVGPGDRFDAHLLTAIESFGHLSASAAQRALERRFNTARTHIVPGPVSAEIITAERPSLHIVGPDFIADRSQDVISDAGHSH